VRPAAAREGRDAVIARHELAGRAMLAGVEALGLVVFGDVAHKMSNVVAVEIPEGVPGDAARSALLEDFGIEIGTSFGPLHGKVWRIGTMGYNARKDAVLTTLAALESVLRRFGRGAGRWRRRGRRRRVRRRPGRLRPPARPSHGGDAVTSASLLRRARRHRRRRARVMARCEELARVSADAASIERVYLSPEHARVNRLAAEWMRELGMRTWQDAAGNQVGRIGDPAAPALMLGSHLDTVLDAGRYDGIGGADGARGRAAAARAGRAKRATTPAVPRCRGRRVLG
jgi:hypothetical protein